MERRYLLVTGQVQGVGFRWFAKMTASRLGLTGYVRNRGDGAVELEVQGGAYEVEEFAHAVSTGPRYACVETVEQRVLPLEDEGGFRTQDAWE